MNDINELRMTRRNSKEQFEGDIKWLRQVFATNHLSGLHPKQIRTINCFDYRIQTKQSGFAPFALGIRFCSKVEIFTKILCGIRSE